MYVALLPCYNVEQHVGAVINGLKKQSDIYAVVAVDDGSADNTAEVIQAHTNQHTDHAISYPDNRGKGAALNVGLEYIQAHFPDATGVILIDSDGQHDPAEAQDFITKHKRTHAHILLGTRSFNKTMPLIRRISNKITSYLVSKKFSMHIPDPLNGYKLLSAEFLQDFEICKRGYEVDLEILHHAHKNYMSISSVPTRTIYAENHPPLKSLPLKEVWRQFVYILKL